MFKVTSSGDGDVFDLLAILEGLKVTMRQFQEMCIAAGCDYLRNIKGIGIHRAFHLSATRDILEALAQKGADETYQGNFHKAMAVFNHQTVFDMETCCTVPHQKLDADPPMDVQNLCGYNLDLIFSNELAVGNVNTKNWEKVNSFALFTKLQVTKRNEAGYQLAASSTESINIAETQEKVFK